MAPRDALAGIAARGIRPVEVRLPAWDELNTTGSLPLPGTGLPLGLQVLAADNRRGFAVAEWVASVLG